MIPFLDLKAQHSPLKNEILEAFARVVDSCQFVLGEEVSAFEKEFSDFSRVSYSSGVSSGTSALQLAMLAAGIAPGDEVITVPMTFVATTAAIDYIGATPVFVDVDPETYTMDPARVESAITERTRAIVPVHLYGQTADMDPILEIARRHNLKVIEDAAQAHGAEYKGRRAGSIGDLGCFSFYPGKNLGACGEGGCITTGSEALNSQIRVLRDWGQTQKYHHDFKGFNFRMDGLQGAALRIKLRHLEKWTEARRAHAKLYRELLHDVEEITLPLERPECRHVYHIFPILTRERDRLREFLLERGIQSAMHYPIPVHQTKAYASDRYHEGEFPVAERISREELSLPMFAELSDGQIEQVASGVRAFFSGSR